MMHYMRSDIAQTVVFKNGKQIWRMYREGQAVKVEGDYAIRGDSVTLHFTDGHTEPGYFDTKFKLEK